MNDLSWYVDRDGISMFNTRLAVLVGVDQALFLNKLQYWISKNMGVTVDGQLYVWNTYKDWVKGKEDQDPSFPFWTERHIRTVITHCERERLVVSIKPFKSRWRHEKAYCPNYSVLSKKYGYA